MNKRDMNEIWRLIGRYRKNDPRLRDQELLNDWYNLLKPYSVEDASNAVLDYFRTAKYWPDPSDITMRCPNIEAERPQQRESCHHFTAREIARINEEMEELFELGQLMEKDYEAAGLPHPVKARTMGWSISEWIDRCKEAVE